MENISIHGIDMNVCDADVRRNPLTFLIVIVHVLFVISGIKYIKIHKISMQHNVVYLKNIYKIINKFWMIKLHIKIL